MKLFRLVFLLFSISLVSLTAFAQSPEDRQLADQYLNNGEYEKAVPLYDKLMDRDPFGTYPQYIRCLLALRQYEVSEKVIKKQIKKAPDNLTYQVDLGYLYSLQGLSDKSKSTYEKAIKLLKPEQGMIVNLANSFLMRQENDLALATYEQGRKIMRGTYSFHFETAEVYYQKGDYAGMVEEYLDAVQENPNFQQGVQNTLQIRVAGNDQDASRVDLIRTGLLRRIQKNPDRPEFPEMLIWLFIQQKDFESAFIQAKGLDKRLKEDGSRILSLGQMAASNMNYDAAISCFQYVVDKGKDNYNYITAKMELLNTLNKKITESNNYTTADLVKLEKDYTDALTDLGRSGKTAPLIKGLAHLRAFYLDKTDEAMTDLDDAIALPGISRQLQAECKLELGDIYLFTGNVWDSDLLYAQVDKDFKNDPLGQEAKYRGARLDYFRGDFLWASGQLEVLKSATSQLIANDALSLSLLISDNMGLDSTTDALMLYAKADLLNYRNKNKEALEVLDTLIAQFPFHSLLDDAWFKMAIIMDEERNWKREDSLYALIVEKDSASVLADDALFRRGVLHQDKMRDNTTAMQLYQDLLVKYPGSLFVVEARKRYRALRGDVLNN